MVGAEPEIDAAGLFPPPRGGELFSRMLRPSDVPVPNNEKEIFMKTALWFVFASLAAVSLTVATEPQSGPLAVRILPMHTDEKGNRSIELYMPSQHFYVVVTNVSRDPLKLWREWCSWGYYNLSFQTTGPGGKTILIKKKPMEWTKNYPDWTLISPGDAMVFEVSLDEETWENSPLPARNKNRDVKLTAVFEVRPDGESKQHGVWTGKAESPELYLHDLAVAFVEVSRPGSKSPRKNPATRHASVGHRTSDAAAASVPFSATVCLGPALSWPPPVRLSILGRAWRSWTFCPPCRQMAARRLAFPDPVLAQFGPIG